MQIFITLIFGITFATAGFIAGAWWTGTHTGQAIATGLQTAMRKGIITEADAASILDWIDEA